MPLSRCDLPNLLVRLLRKSRPAQIARHQSSVVLDDMQRPTFARPSPDLRDDVFLCPTVTATESVIPSGINRHAPIIRMGRVSSVVNFPAVVFYRPPNIVFSSPYRLLLSLFTAYC